MWRLTNSSPRRVRMEQELCGSPEWNRIQAKLRCSLPSAQLVQLQRVENATLWTAFAAPVADYRDDGGSVRVDHVASGVREVIPF